jgi:hypothetical protein
MVAPELRDVHGESGAQDKSEGGPRRSCREREEGAVRAWPPLLPQAAVTSARRSLSRLWLSAAVADVRRARQYPYVPPHITKPKECKKLFLVQVPPTSERPCHCTLAAAWS